MTNPSYWVFRRGQKWHSGWRDEHGHCHSKVHTVGSGRMLAQEYARKRAIESCQVRAGQPLNGREVAAALEAFLAREDVKTCTHDLNRRHLEAFVDHFKMRSVNEITGERVNAWLGHLKAKGYNPGGQSLSLRILRTFCRYCRKKHWLAHYPFDDFKIPKSQFVGRYLSDDERTRFLSINPRYHVDRRLNCALTFGFYSLLRISQVFSVDWSHFRPPDQLWVSGIKGQDARWIALHPKALEVMGERKELGQVFDHWETLAAFREAVYKKAKREKLFGVRFHETKHTGISALLEAGYSIPEVCKISGNSMRTIAHYSHVNEQRAFEKWKAFDYGERSEVSSSNCTAAVQQETAKQGPHQVRRGSKGEQGENAKRIQIATNSLT